MIGVPPANELASLQKYNPEQDWQKYSRSGQYE
jgi:hypothetical protein